MKTLEQDFKEYFFEMCKERQELKQIKGTRSTISDEDRQNFRRFSDDEGGIYKNHTRTSSCGSAGSQGKIFKISKVAQFYLQKQSEEQNSIT